MMRRPRKTIKDAEPIVSEHPGDVDDPGLAAAIAELRRAWHAEADADAAATRRREALEAGNEEARRLHALGYPFSGVSAVAGADLEHLLGAPPEEVAGKALAEVEQIVERARKHAGGYAGLSRQGAEALLEAARVPASHFKGIMWETLLDEGLVARMNEALAELQELAEASDAATG